MSMDLSGFVKQKTKITIGTKEFIFSELTLRDLAEFRGDMTKKRKEINQERRNRLIEDAKKIGNVDPLAILKFSDEPVSEEEVEAEMETIEGLGFLAYLSLRPNHTGISKEEALGIISPRVIEKISAAMFPTMEDKPKKKPARKTKP